MINEITKKLESLKKLNKTAHNPKILWEEMQLVSEKCFKLQEEILTLIQEAEEQEKNISALQTLFETREVVWDIINDTAAQELLIKEKTLNPVKETECCNEHSSECNSKKCCCHKKH